MRKLENLVGHGNQGPYGKPVAGLSLRTASIASNIPPVKFGYWSGISIGSRAFRVALPPVAA
jgi:hypothetical protein